MAADARLAGKTAIPKIGQPEATANPVTALARPMRIKKNPAAVSLGRRGGKARAASMSNAERSESARKAVASRWAAMTPEQRSEAAKKAARKRKK